VARELVEDLVADLSVCVKGDACEIERICGTRSDGGPNGLVVRCREQFAREYRKPLALKRVDRWHLCRVVD
jgi:hypothetical protein